MIKTKELRRPILMYNITEDCQLRCRHCYNESGGARRYTPAAKRLYSDVDKISRVAGAVNFTGGEPFLVPELPRLIGLTRSNGADAIVTTNGLCLMGHGAPSLLQRIEGYVYMVKIGMMGATPETNDFIRGSGHFDVAVKGLDLLANYDVVSCIKVSLSRHNMHEIESFMRLALDHRVDQIVFGQLVSVGRASSYLGDLVPSLDDTWKMGEEVWRVKEKYWGAVKIARHCTLSGLCSEPGYFYTVTTKGSMSPCLMREDLAIGDIMTDDLGSLIKTTDSVRENNKMHSSCKDLRPISGPIGSLDLLFGDA